MRGKNILVCGGCGFMGSDFILTLLERAKDTHVVNVDALTYAATPDNLKDADKKRYRFVKGDICDTELMKKLMQDSDIVVNFAAETHVDRSIHTSGEQFMRTNVLGVHSLLEALRVSPNVKKMIHISTDEVWGDLPLTSKEKFTEDSPFRPNSPYAASKAAGDLLIRSYVRTHNVPVVVTHSVNNFGPRQFPEKLIPFFTSRALEDKSLPLYGTGENMRDWLYVGDHSEAILAVMEKGDVGEAYNISSGKEYSNLHIAQRILDILGKSHSLITYVKDRPGHDLRYSVDSSKLRALGWKPRSSLEERLPETIEWFIGHQSTSTGQNAHIT